MRRMAVVVVVAMVASLSGCGGSSGSGGPDGTGVEGAPGRADAARSAGDETFRLVSEAVQAVSYSSSGGGRWVICGMEPDPSGAEYVAEVAIAQSNTGSAEQSELISSALASAGWEVAVPSTDLVEATKGELTFRAERGTNLSIRSGCIDVDTDDVRRLTDEPRDDLGLSLGP